jgi:peptide/nickel transport system substrate-binding protein
LERREDWYMHEGVQVRPKPHFKTIRYRVIEDSNTALLALKNGDVEDMEFQPEQWVEQTSDSDFYRLNTKARGTQWVYYYFGWNCNIPLFEDARVRRAMSYCVDYDHILETLCYGLYPPCTSEYHKDSWMGPEKPRVPFKQDFDKAEALLEEAGWVDNDGDGVREKMINGKKVKFEFTIMCFNQQLRVDICTSLKDSLDRIGIVCRVRPTEFTVMQEKARAHEFQAMFGGWGTGTDPFSTENLWKTGEGRNYGEYSNTRVDELFIKAKYELEQDKRAVSYREIDDILWEEQPYTWLYYRSAFYGFNKKLRGYAFSPRGPFNYGPGFDSIWAVAE